MYVSAICVSSIKLCSIFAVQTGVANSVNSTSTGVNNVASLPQGPEPNGGYQTTQQQPGKTPRASPDVHLSLSSLKHTHTLPSVYQHVTL